MAAPYPSLVSGLSSWEAKLSLAAGIRRWLCRHRPVAKCVLCRGLAYHLRPQTAFVWMLNVLDPTGR